MSGDMGKLWREHLRLILLRVLQEAPAYTANESILHDSVGPLGVRATRDQLLVELAWLKEQGLIATEELHGMTVASATKRGVEVAGGVTTVPGVRRPGPRD